MGDQTQAHSSHSACVKPCSLYTVSAEEVLLCAAVVKKWKKGTLTASNGESASAVIFYSLVSHMVNITGICPYEWSGSKWSEKRLMCKPSRTCWGAQLRSTGENGPRSTFGLGAGRRLQGYTLLHDNILRSFNVRSDT